MGVENFVDGPVAGKRKSKRARVLIAARVQSDAGEIEVRLRDLSRRGALIECDVPLQVASEVIFSRGTTFVPSRVAWASGNRAGLEFSQMIDESDVLLQLNRGEEERPPHHFRPTRLYGDDMSAQDKELARVWARSVGIMPPGR